MSDSNELHISPIGMVPKDWPLRRLDKVAEVAYGISEPIDRSLQTGISILSLPNVSSECELRTDEVPLIDPSLVRDRDYLRHGDILFNWRNGSTDHLGKVAYFNLGQPHTHVSFLLRVRSTSALHPKFLFYYLQLVKQRGFYLNSKIQVNNTFNKEELSEVPVVVPPQVVQIAIESVLSTWDRSIRQLTDLIAVKILFKQGLMQQLLTGKRRFKEFGNNPWSEYHLGELFTERDETNCVELPLLSITADRGVIPRTDVDRKDTSNENKSLYKRIAPGDIGYNTMRMWQGVSAVSRYEGIVSPAYTICIPGPDFDADFAGYLFKYPPVIYLFYRFSQGLVDDTLNLKFHHFAQIRVRIPSVKEQKQIAQVFMKCDEEIDVLRKQLETLKQQKKGLMQKLLTGEVRVVLKSGEANA